MLVVPPLSLCHSLRSSFDGKGHSRAHTHSVCVRVSAHEGHHFARTRDLCHRRTSEESGRERGAVRRQKKYHRGRGAVVRHARETPPTSRRRGKKFLLFPLTPSLSRFPFVPGFDRGSTKLLLPPAVVRSKSSASSPLSTFNRRWQLNTDRPYENYHFFYVNRTYANCSDLRLPNRCFHHLLSSFKCQFFSLLHFFISCYKQKIFRGLISRS